MTRATADDARVLVFGTRGSALARAQTAEALRLLRVLQPAVATQMKVISTRGDREQAAALSVIGGQGVFTKELQSALLDGSIDAAVHSLKDLPPVVIPSLRIAAFLPRADARDALVSRSRLPLAQLPSGSSVGTGSARRRAFLLLARPDIDVRDIRGNVDTRVRKVTGGQLDAVVLAAAGLARLGLLGEAAEIFPPEVSTPAPGQGILAIETRDDDDFALAAVTALDTREARVCAVAERGFLARLGSGCSRPAAAYATVDGATILLRGGLADDDGSRLIRRRISGPAEGAAALGASLAASLMAARGGAGG